MKKKYNALKAGDKVIICHNPHHPWVDGIVGTVVVYRPVEGFWGCDLVDVHYKNPKDGKGHTMPFRLASLGGADTASLAALAGRYEGLATHLRTLAAHV